MTLMRCLVRLAVVVAAAGSGNAATAACLERHPLTSHCLRSDNSSPSHDSPWAVAQRRVNSASESAKIVGGVLAEQGQDPWQVALVLKDKPTVFDGQFCGGANIGGGWVLTAAHCVDEAPASALAVYSGSTSLRGGGRLTPVERVVVHPNWDRERVRNDIALLLVQGGAAGLVGQPVEGPADIPPAMLPLLKLRTTGWGNSLRLGDDSGREPELMSVELPVVDEVACNAPPAYDGLITPQMLCAGPEDTSKSSCNGDSGGPATVEFAGLRRLVGIVSFGKAGCQGRHAYSVFTRVSAYGPWIRQVVTELPR
ncbi:MAG: serine protease [Rhodoferax sp.]|nr:serine protease [Rhodoferax sp.]